MLSARAKRFSKCASSSVFSACPSFSSVNCREESRKTHQNAASASWIFSPPSPFLFYMLPFQPREAFKSPSSKIKGNQVKSINTQTEWSQLKQQHQASVGGKPTRIFLLTHVECQGLKTGPCFRYLCSSLGKTQPLRDHLFNTYHPPRQNKLIPHTMAVINS